MTCECCGYDENDPKCICVGWDPATRRCDMCQVTSHPKTAGASSAVFEVVTIDGAIEKRDPDELISYEEMTVLNDEFIAFLEKRGYGFGGIMRGSEGLRTIEPVDEHLPPPPPPQSKDSGVSVREGGRPVPMPTTAVHPLESYSQPAPRWLGVVVCAVFVLAIVVPGILLLVL